MSKRIVTQHAVTEVAEALSLEGLEPSIVAVQSRIGGGSFSTVKRFLDVWKQEKAEAATAALETPPEVQSKGQEFAHTVWALASREARREMQQAREEAGAEVTAVRGELNEATTEIARLEQVESEQAAVIHRQSTKLREVELALVEAQAQARRVPGLEKSLTDIRAELDAARKEATDNAVETGRLMGEAEALRAQVRDLMAAIKKT